MSAITLTNIDWLLAAPCQAVFSALSTRGHTVRAVGGAIRNALLGEPITDVDLATTAPPDVVMTMAIAGGLKAIPTGIEHGTVTIVAHGTPFEVTTLRKDVATDGRHATVAFSTDWTADARRRDFTMNALYCDAAGIVFDPLDGLRDVIDRRVRFVGAPDARIREDFLRIMRFFRFNAQFGRPPYDTEGLTACARGRDGLALVSSERNRAELLKLLAAPHAMAAIEALSDWGLLVDVVRAVPRLHSLRRLIAIERQIGLSPDPIRRLGVLALHAPGDGERLAACHRLSAADRQRLERLEPYVPAGDLPTSERAAQADLYRHGLPRWRDAMLAAWARSQADLESPTWHARLTLPDRWPVPDFPVRGADLMALGVEKGPKIGSLLEGLRKHWIDGGFHDQRDDLIAYARKLMIQSRSDPHA